MEDFVVDLGDLHRGEANVGGDEKEKKKSGCRTDDQKENPVTAVEYLPAKGSRMRTAIAASSELKGFGCVLRSSRFISLISSHDGFPHSW